MNEPLGYAVVVFNQASHCPSLVDGSFADTQYQPEKAAEFTPYMTFWWLVVSDKALVKPGELPDGWGLMAPRGGQLAVVTKAARRKPEPLPRTMLASLLRAVMKTAISRAEREAKP